MTNVEKLRKLHVLGDIRRRLGAEYESDTQYDYEINNMSADELTAEWAGWKIGDNEWWKILKRIYDTLNEKE